MDTKELIIGSHVNMNAPDFLLGSVKQAIEYKANTFMCYTGAPQNSVRIPVEKLKVLEAKEMMQQNNINPKDVVVHAPYLINLANLDQEKYQFSVRMLLDEVKRVEKMGFEYLVLHPGSHLKEGFEKVLLNVIKGLNYVLDNTNNVTILLETMAGKGNEIGRTFEEINLMLKGVTDQSRIGVCLDTCHIFDAGYDIVNDLDFILDHFDQLIGLNRIKVVHINDSKNYLNSHKDRHENIGFGQIGFESLVNIIYHPKLSHTIKILETPYVEQKAPYKKEIEMIRKKVFNQKLKEEL
ncbi:MAG: deoxyribonuclease IV [Erysipelotrichaceae bacterium]|nr:deoxyribonuclease IV [Erysipelotrichaceae bacterium]